MANKLLSLNSSFKFKQIVHMANEVKPMTFEQWAEKMKESLSPKTDEKLKSPTQSDDRSDWEMEDEESFNLPLEKN
jgi:hypothetical protein